MNNIILSKNKTIKSNELVEIINQFRNIEGKNPLEHKEFMRNIRKEIDILNSLNIDVGGNFPPSYYIDSQGKQQNCFELDKKAMRIMLNRESTLVRYKTEEYIEKLEDDLYNKNNYFYMVEKTKYEIGLIDSLASSLNMNDNSKLMLITKSFENNGINTNLLPNYTKSEGILKSATELLKLNNVNISAQKFNSLLVEKGILKECTRPSSKDDTKVKKFKNLVNTYYGENLVNPRNTKETQPMYYEDKFKELLKEIDLI